MVQVALGARDQLAERDVSAEVVNCRFVKPMDRQALQRLERDFPLRVTLEENTVVGGFGAGVVDQVEQDGLSCEGIVRIGLPDEFVTQGTREQLLDKVGLTPARVAATVLDRLDRRSERE